MTDKKAERLQHVAELLNAVGRDTETKILSTLEESNPNLASQIRDRMFTFDDLTLIDSRQMQLLLKELNSEVLVLSLKTASDAVKELVFSSVSTKAAEGMKDDLESLGPRRREDVEVAQMKIVQAARKLMEEGKIVILGSDTV
ncbi:MAG TPA: FliG C-terminal domain-containing protein [SAR324 cluster bacterium]|nr:FliG C-terminal domain-containing protein [SAR324 cluster bacterium]